MKNISIDLNKALRAASAGSFPALMKKVLILLMFVSLAGCGDDAPTNNADDLRKAMLQSLAENVIVPGYAELDANAAALGSAVSALTATPSLANLESAQAAWIALGKNWKRMEFFQQGLLDQERQDSLIYKIDLGAADLTKRAAIIDRAALNNAVTTLLAITPAYVEALPAKLQGMPVIEELLFDTSSATALARLTSNVYAENYRDFLKAATSSLRARLAMVHQSWDQSGGNFQQQFINAFGTDLGSSLGMLINDVVTLAESIKNEKVARPLGLYSNTTPIPDSVEALRSGQSTAFIIENVNGIERMFTADAEGRVGVGIDSLLNALDAKVGEIDVSTAVLAQLKKIRDRATPIGRPLPDAIRANDANVSELYEDCRVLLKLLKVDVVSQLGVMITTLEGDGD